jgi:hypothetical protein
VRAKHLNEAIEAPLEESRRHIQPNRQMLRFPIERTPEWHTPEDSDRLRPGRVGGRVASSGAETATADMEPAGALVPLSGGRRRPSIERTRLPAADREKRTKERRPATGAHVLTNLQASRAFRQRCVAAGLLSSEPSAATLVWVADIVYQTLRQAHREQAAVRRRQRESHHQSRAAVA